MARTFFQDYNQNTPIVSTWLNDVNNAVYGANGTPRLAVSAAAAWVRFEVVDGVVTIQQSQGVESVTRLSTGQYLVTYAAPLSQATNAYYSSQNSAGFSWPSTETTTSVEINFSNTANTFTDPGTASVMIFGAN
jgi:hypothetical protein